jgi:membrane-bound lytic murein transglycosylase B
MKNYGFPLLAIVLGLMLGFTRPAHAQGGDFAQWLAGLRRDAVAQGVPAATVDRAFAGV